MARIDNSSAASVLARQLEACFAQARQPDGQGAHARLFIVPHASYVYSGRTAAFAYQALRCRKWKRVVLLGPSHRAYFRGCFQCPFARLATPLGSLATETIDGLPMNDPDVDCGEHSLELQFPFLKHCFPEGQIKVLPIMVGSLSETNSESTMPTVQRIARLVADPDTAMVVSSDFCHYGSNYEYCPPLSDYAGSDLASRIRTMDHLALQAISTGDPLAFLEYLSATHNTICGRNPIVVAMQTIRLLGFRGRWQWLHYEQSRQIKALEPSKNDSSVSYVAGAFVCPPSGY